MKNLKLIFPPVALSLGILLAACSETEPYGEKALDYAYTSSPFVDPLTLSFDANSSTSSKSLRINNPSYQSWSARKYESWLHFDYRSNPDYYYTGSGTYLAIYADDNPGESRSATITITRGSSTKTVSVTQAGTSLKVSPESLSFDATSSSAKTLSITTSSYQSWTATKSVSWLHFSYSSNSNYSYSGSGTTSLSIYADNNTGASRSATITFTAGSITKTVSVTQVEAPISVQWGADASTFASGGDWWWVEITAPSTQSWTLSSSVTWIKFDDDYSRSGAGYSTWSGYGSQKVYINAAPNPYYSSRSGTVYVKRGSTTIASRTYTQEGK